MSALVPNGYQKGSLMTVTAISRRGFLKGAAAAATALTVAGSAQLLEDVPEASAAVSVERIMHKTACHG